MFRLTTVGVEDDIEVEHHPAENGTDPHSFYIKLGFQLGIRLQIISQVSFNEHKIPAQPDNFVGIM